jgi:hypothetical protein
MKTILIAIAVALVAYTSTANGGRKSTSEPVRNGNAAADPSLVSVNITFQLPKCDDRDHDTLTKAWVTQGNTVIAENDNVAPGQQLGDPGTYGPYSLPLQNTISKSAWAGTVTHIHIDPVGHDTWCTEFLMDALFDDNSHVKSNNCSVVKISEANRDYQFPSTACQQN